MEKLYSYRGEEPYPLPHQIWVSDSFARTDPSTFTDEEISAAGFTGPYVKPEYDSEIETLVWNSEKMEWDVELLPEEMFWNRFRQERMMRLVTSDWTHTLDSPLSDSKKAQWAAYRQALRDLPENISDIRRVTWPDIPN